MRPWQLLSIFVSVPTRIALGLLLAVGVSSCRAAGSADASSSQLSLDQLSAIASLPRMLVPQLTVASSYQRCSALEGDTITAGAVCMVYRKPPRAIVELASRASASLARSTSADALHAVALVDLLWSDSAGKSLERSIKYLRSAASVAADPVPALADLSAAQIVRAKRRRNARDLVLGLESAQMALDHEPRNRQARFNVALALEEFGLQEQSLRRWDAYGAVDSASPWRLEAERRARAMRALSVRPRTPSIGDRWTVVAEYATAAPQQARELGWNESLGRWGAAVSAGASGPHVDSLLTFADSLGANLARQSGDRSLADAVSDIRHAEARGDVYRLARAFASIAAGQHDYEIASYATAKRAFADAAAQASASPIVHAWADVFLGICDIYVHERVEGENLLRHTVDAADVERYPALAARARWALASSMLRSGRFEGLAHARVAEALFGRSGEREYLGAVQSLEGEEYLVMGDLPAAYAQLRRAVLTLRPYTNSVWRHNALYALELVAARDNQLRFASVVQDEALSVAASMTLPAYKIEAELVRVGLHLSRGEPSDALAELSGLRPFILALPQGPLRARFNADWQLAYSQALSGARRGDSLAVLDSAIQYFATNDNPALLFPALLQRASTFLSRGRLTSAVDDFENALDLVNRRTRDIADAPLRASMFDDARVVVDRLVSLQLGNAHAAEALRTLERGRQSLMLMGQPPTAHAPPLRSPRGVSTLEYAFINDTLVVWVIDDRGTRATRLTVSRDELARRVDRMRASLELGASAASSQGDLATLYDWLLRPLEKLLPNGACLTIIADAEIGRVPFSALYDARQSRYAIEKYLIRYATDLRSVARLPSHSIRPNTRALIVADPATTEADLPGAARLPGAHAEADSIAALYADHTMLEGAEASPQRMLAALAMVEIFHFAGHAVFDNERPEHSFLAVTRTDSGSGRLTAEALAHLKLGHLRLVVLSSCETMPSRASRSSGFAGLTTAFLSAGARGVVGTSWPVDDDQTSALLIAFHRAYRESGDAAAALREAQLRLLRSPDPQRRAPAAWAAFRYAGE